jgi:dienelactone hydrolase
MNSPTLTNIQVTPELGGLLAVPQGAGPWPAVVMVHEVFGIDDNMKAQATRLSQAGYVVLMPNPADAQDAWLRIEKFFTEHLSA